jgi:RNA polymerase sigma factor (sigma-70 family)
VPGNLAVARRESVVNNRALDFGPASLGVVSAPSNPSCGQSQVPLAMPANGTSQRARLVPTRGASGDGTAPVPGDPEHYQAMFVSNLDVIETVIRQVCLRQKLSGSEAEDFDSEVKVRLVDHDYEVFRKFQHRSSLRTYLTIVIQRIYLDYRNHLWGKWRPSAEAQRLGPVAVRLETLMARDGFAFDQAFEYLRTNEHVAATDSDLYGIFVRLPIRTRRAMVGEEEIEAVADSRSAVDDPLLYNQRHADARRILDALTVAIQSLTDQDRVILRLRFQDGLAVADIARALHLDQKPLYRRFETLLRQLRAALESAGIDPREASELVERNDMDISLALLARTSGADDPGAGPAGAEGGQS